MFQLDLSLVSRAKATLRELGDIYWTVGGSASGKSTVCQAIAAKYAVMLIDLDERVFSAWQGRFRPDRHPASTAWFGASNPLAYMLTLPWVEFDALYRAADAEYLDLLVDDLADHDASRPLLVDGGISHPAVLAQVLPASRMVCLATPREESRLQWETSPERASMRKWIAGLEKPEEKWRRFLIYNDRMSSTIVEESVKAGIPVLWRYADTDVGELEGLVAERFGMRA